MASLPAQRPAVHVDRRRCTRMYETRNETAQIDPSAAPVQYFCVYGPAWTCYCGSTPNASRARTSSPSAGSAKRCFRTDMHASIAVTPGHPSRSAGRDDLRHVFGTATCIWPPLTHTAAQPRRVKDHEIRCFCRSQALICVSGCGAGGARTHDRRIMSPARQQPLSGWLAWADIGSRDRAQADLDTYWA
jgi:hypothetical protein